VQVRVEARILGEIDRASVFYRSVSSGSTGSRLLSPSGDGAWSGDLELPGDTYEMVVAVTGPTGPASQSAGTVGGKCGG
jgi:hypothetical protein